MNTARVLERRLRSHRLSAPAPHGRRSGRAHARHPGAGVLGRPLGARRAHEGRSERARRRCGLRPRRDRPLVDDAGHDPRHPRARPRLGAHRDRRAPAPARPPCVRRVEGIDAAELARAERLTLRALARRQQAHPQGAVRRARAGRRRPLPASAGYHLLVSLSLRAVVCQGPVVPRESGPTREQYVVLTDEWVTDAASPADPARRVLRPVHRLARPGRGAGLRVVVGTAARVLAGRCGGGIRSPEHRLRRRRAAVRRRRRRRRALSAGAHEVLALPPYEEYYLSYTDRTVPCAPEFLARIGPSMNGIVRPILARARRGRRCLDALGRGRPALGCARARAVRAGRGDGCRGRCGAGPLPSLHHRLSAAVPHCDP